MIPKQVTETAAARGCVTIHSATYICIMRYDVSGIIQQYSVQLYVGHLHLDAYSSSSHTHI